MDLNFPMIIDNNVQEFLVPFPSDDEPTTSLHIEVPRLKRPLDHGNDGNVPKKVRVFQVVEIQEPENQSANTANYNTANTSAPVSATHATPVTCDRRVTAVTTDRHITLVTTDRRVTDVKTDILAAALKTDTPVTAAKTNRHDTALKTDILATALKTDILDTALKTDILATALKTDILDTALKTDILDTALKTDILATALKTDRHVAAVKTDIPATALKTDRRVAAVKTDRLATALKTDRRVRAVKTDRPVTAVKTDVLAIALKTDILATPLKTDKLKTYNKPVTAAKTNGLDTAPKTDILATALKTDILDTALKTAILDTALKTDILDTALKTDILDTALKTDILDTALKTNRLATALKTDRRVAAVKADRLATALKTDRRVAAVKTDRLATALKTDRRVAAVKTDRLATALKDDSSVTTVKTNTPVAYENLKMMVSSYDIPKKIRYLTDLHENFDTPEPQDLINEEPENDTTEMDKSKFVHKLVRRRAKRKNLQKQFNSKMKTESGTYPTVLVHLKKVVEELKLESLCKEKTICTIMFDELVLDKYVVYCPSVDKISGYVDLGDAGGRTGEIADRVLVFMLQNIKKVIQHPIAHYFFKGPISPKVLSIIIKNVIRKVRETGFDVIATVCNQAPTHMGALNLLKGADASIDLNYYLIDDKKVYIVYNVPHLFKSIRNNLILFGELVLDDKSVKLSHLDMVETKNSSTLHFTKITKEHISKVDWSKREIKLATEILSGTVSGVLKALSESKVNIAYKDEILEASEVVDDLDKLFDCTNGASCSKEERKPSRANVQTSSFHHSLWIELKNKLQNSRFNNTNYRPCFNNVRCINGFVITISSLQDIWQYVHEALSSFNVNCLNMDSLEDLIEFIEKRKPRKFNHMTCQFYEVSIATIFLEALILGAKKRNREIYDELLDFSDFLVMDDTGAENNGDDLWEYCSDEDYGLPKSDKEISNLFEKFEKQPNVFISAYLASKLLKDCNCENCCNVLELNEIDKDFYHNHTLLNELWEERCAPIYPSKKLCKTVKKAVKVFDVDVKPQLYMKNILDYCVATMSTECEVSWMCEEHGAEISKHLFRLLGTLLIRNHCRLENDAIANMELGKSKPQVNTKSKKTKRK